jgi:hypothetical protein
MNVTCNRCGEKGRFNGYEPKIEGLEYQNFEYMRLLERKFRDSWICPRCRIEKAKKDGTLVLITRFN